MKTISVKTVFFLGCILIFSCKSSKNIPVFDINKINQSIGIDLSDILKDISVVQISTDFLLSVNDNIYVTSKYLVVYRNKFGSDASLLLFGRDGAYIRKLAEQGRGPGEFYLIGEFFVDDEEQILYYVEMFHRTHLNRIDISSGMTLEPLQIDLTSLELNYVDGEIYGIPTNRFTSNKGNKYTDSAIVACRISLPSGEIKKYQGEHKYEYYLFGSSMTSYRGEVCLMNLGYSDTLFTLSNNKLSPLCVMRLSDKMTDYNKGGSGIRIISAYQNGVILLKFNMEPRPRGGIGAVWKYFALYDGKESMNKIDYIRVMNTKISLIDSDESPRTHWSLSPIPCGKYGYMMVEHDVLDAQSLNLDPDNDNPIIIVGAFK